MNKLTPVLSAKGKGKKAVVSELTIPLSTIKTTKVQIKF